MESYQRADSCTSLTQSYQRDTLSCEGTYLTPHIAAVIVVVIVVVVIVIVVVVIIVVIVIDSPLTRLQGHQKSLVYG